MAGRVLALLVTAFLVLPAVAGDDPIFANLDKAKAAHAKELARLREKLLADIDAVIREENDRGAGIDYLLKERKGFADNGVPPILPKLLPASSQYVEGKKAADAALAAAVTAAVDASVRAEKPDQAAALRAELRKAEVSRAKSDYTAAMKAASAELVAAF